MLDLAMGIAPGGPSTPFADVPASAWFAPYVEAAVQAGLVEGASAITFSPNATMSRAQMAVMVARALKLTKTAALSFTDAAQIAPGAVAGVEEAVAAGCISGFSNGSFQPLAAASRAEAAVLLA